MRSLGEKLSVLSMKKLLVLLLASAIAPMLSAADFSTGGHPTVVIGGHTFDRAESQDDSTNFGFLKKFGMAFICFENQMATCVSPDPRAKGRVWIFQVHKGPDAIGMRSHMASVDVDCSRYMAKVTSLEGFKDYYAQELHGDYSELAKQRSSWEPIKPGSIYDAAGLLVCPNE